MLLTQASPEDEGLRWQHRGACADTDPETFFPERGRPTEKEAKRVCARCDVQRACLEYALGRGEKFGVWGGKSETERRAFVRRRAALR